MAVLDGLNNKVFYYFEQICGIPHASYHEKAISDYLVEFAKEHNLEYYQDELFNVIIIKEASEGYESIDPIIIQGHMDMVAEHDSEIDIDMLSDPLDIYIDGDYIKAKGTTLGGDDGIAVAMALAILDDDKLAHPRIEFVCTVSEEVGMDGAREIDVSMLKGKKLLNIDSEEEGIFTCGCAGGAVVSIELLVNKQEPVDATPIEIDVTGCTGGHSGTSIIYGRANANRMLLRLLTAASAAGDITIAELAGGNKDNVITREASATIYAIDNEEAVIAAIECEARNLMSEYYKTDPDMDIMISHPQVSPKCISTIDTLKVIGLMNSLPNGIIAMNQILPDQVETSLNLGVIKLSNNAFKLSYCVRSNTDSSFDFLVCRMKSAALVAGARTTIVGRYYAWPYKKNSVFRDELVKLYKDMYDKEPKIETIHAGVECSLFVKKIDDIDCISIGPDILDIHSSREALSISSTKRVYEFVINYLQKK